MRCGTASPTSGHRFSLTNPKPASASPDGTLTAVAQTSQLPCLPLSLPPQALGWRHMALCVLSMTCVPRVSAVFPLLLMFLGLHSFLQGLYRSKCLQRRQHQLLPVLDHLFTTPWPGVAHEALQGRHTPCHLCDNTFFFFLSAFLPTSHITPFHPPKNISALKRSISSAGKTSWQEDFGSLRAGRGLGSLGLALLPWPYRASLARRQCLEAHVPCDGEDPYYVLAQLQAAGNPHKRDLGSSAFPQFGPGNPPCSLQGGRERIVRLLPGSTRPR